MMLKFYMVFKFYVKLKLDGNA